MSIMSRGRKSLISPRASRTNESNDACEGVGHSIPSGAPIPTSSSAKRKCAVANKAEHGLKAATDRSYHGGSFRGGYGRGLAADVVSVKGRTGRSDGFPLKTLPLSIDISG